MDKTKQKGYVLAIVLIVSFLLAATVTAAFAVIYRYYRLAQKDIEHLRADIIAEEFVSAENDDFKKEGTT